MLAPSSEEPRLQPARTSENSTREPFLYSLRRLLACYNDPDLLSPLKKLPKECVGGCIEEDTDDLATLAMRVLLCGQLDVPIEVDHDTLLNL